MFLLYSLNLAIIVPLALLPIYYYTKCFNMKWINPFSISFVFGFPSFIFITFIGPIIYFEEGLFDKYYNFTVLMGNIALFIEFIVVYSVMQVLRRTSIKTLFDKCPGIELKYHSMLCVSILSFLFYLLFLYITAQHSYGFVDWLNSPREGYQYHREGVGHYYALSITFLSISYAIILLYSRSIISVFVKFCLYSIFAYFLGSKTVLLTIAIYTIIVLWLNKYKNLKIYLSIVFAFAFIIMAINFFSRTDTVAVLELAEYFDHYRNGAMFFEASLKGEIPLFYGELFATRFWDIIPRALYPDKPYAYGNVLINEFFFPGAAERTHTPVFAGPVSYYGDFGIIGVILLPFFQINDILKTVLYYLLFKDFDAEKIRNKSRYLFVFIWLFAPSFLMYFSFPLNVLLMAFLILIINVSNRLVLTSRTNNN